MYRWLTACGPHLLGNLSDLDRLTWFHGPWIWPASFWKKSRHQYFPSLHRVTRGAHTLGTSMLCLWGCGSRGCISLIVSWIIFHICLVFINQMNLYWSRKPHLSKGWNSLFQMRHVRHRIRHRNSHSTIECDFGLMQMRNLIMIMRNENSIAFDKIMQKVPRDPICAFDKLRKENSIFILAEKTTSFSNCRTLAKGWMQLFLKIAFDLKFKGFPYYHIIYIKSHSRL